MKKVTRFFGVLIALLLISTNFFIQKEANASPIVCGIRGADPSIGIHNVVDDVSIQCSGAQTWGAIRSTAKFTNSTGRVNNYDNTGGYSRALEHFNQMPGKTEVKSNGTKTKTSEGKTVALYRSTTTDQWSLSYPNGSMTDKIRYY
ncbi:hypothetical protein [Heyndrickxia oleronia]|uniref:Secreted protein n=1 Tax=Heyndrickxia oleronia TaxID=38875 RepID=A0AAW6SY49_9BACI|nr:hypothetical protein [Heyndrickxia oleronia]MDH5161494.1 hypothetical protein [Heyndrickxia oleronia]